MDPKISQSSYLQVKDLAVSAYLYSSEAVRLLGKERLPNGTVVFLFSPKEEAEKLVDQYWNLQAPPIQAKLLFSAQRDLKDMIFGG
jgi:hypothetical protein